MKCKIFKIPLQNEVFDDSKLNQFLGGAQVRQVFASVVNDIESFWSVMVLYEETGAAAAETSRRKPLASTPLSGGKSYSISPAAAIPVKPPAVAPEALSSEQGKCFEALRTWRNERARLEGLPAYVVAHDELLMQIAAAPIKSAEDLLKVKDFGLQRTQIYGAEIVKILSSNT